MGKETTPQQYRYLISQTSSLNYRFGLFTKDFHSNTLGTREFCTFAGQSGLKCGQKRFRVSPFIYIYTQTALWREIYLNIFMCPVIKFRIKILFAIHCSITNIISIALLIPFRTTSQTKWLQYRW